MKALSFHVNLLTYKILLYVINKIEAKYKVYHVNNLKSTIHFTLKRKKDNNWSHVFVIQNKVLFPPNPTHKILFE